MKKCMLHFRVCTRFLQRYNAPQKMQISIQANNMVKNKIAITQKKFQITNLVRISAIVRKNTNTIKLAKVTILTLTCSDIHSDVNRIVSCTRSEINALPLLFIGVDLSTISNRSKKFHFLSYLCFSMVHCCKQLRRWSDSNTLRLRLCDSIDNINTNNDKTLLSASKNLFK